jgi:hypothetical protein
LMDAAASAERATQAANEATRAILVDILIKTCKR